MRRATDQCPKNPDLLLMYSRTCESNAFDTSASTAGDRSSKHAPSGRSSSYTSLNPTLVLRLQGKGRWQKGAQKMMRYCVSPPVEWGKAVGSSGILVLTMHLKEVQMRQ